MRGSVASGPLIVAVLVGLAFGVAGFTFVYARGPSYFTDDATACANCHAMRAAYDRWIASSHHAVARCNDCHAPHATASKYVVKGATGLRHATAFTARAVPDSITLTRPDRELTNRACRTCHEGMVAAISRPPSGPGALDCVRCHAAVGHAA